MHESHHLVHAQGSAIPSLVLFHTSPGLPDRTLQAWSQACLKLGIADSLRAGGQESIRTLLLARSDQISLVDAVRTLTTLRCRRVVKLAEFIPSESGEYFARTGFDCTPEVQADIDKEVQLQIKGLESVEKQQQDLKRIAYFVPPGDLLETFYQAGGRHADHAHRDDLVDPAKWGVKFLDVLAEAVTPLLAGSVKLETGGSVVLLKNAALASALEQLATLKEQLLVPPSIRPRGLVEEAARVLTGLGKTLVVVIRNRSQTADPLARSADPSQLVDPLPHEDERLVFPLEWAGLTVIEALVRAARVCLLAGRFLGDTNVDASLAKAETLRETALAAFDRVERLASPAQATSLKERFSDLLVDNTGTAS